MRRRDTPAAQAWRVHETLAPLTERYALLGWSLGGQFALDLAAAHARSASSGWCSCATTPTLPRLAEAGAAAPPRPLLAQARATSLQRRRRARDRMISCCCRCAAAARAPRRGCSGTLRAALRAHGASAAGGARAWASRGCVTGTCAPRCRWCGCRPWSSPGRAIASSAPAASRALARALAACALCRVRRRRTRALSVAPACSSCTSLDGLSSRALRRHAAFASGPRAGACRLRSRQRQLRCRRAAAGARGARAARAPGELSLRPRVVLDLGAGTGRATRELKRRYPRAQVWRWISPPGCCAKRAAISGLWRRFARVCADAQRCPSRTRSVDLVFSNLMLQWCQPLDAGAAEIRRVLQPGGFFAFSTFGPAYAARAAQAWAAADERHSCQPFPRHARHRGCPDARRADGAGAGCGTAELVYPDVLPLMHDLKAIGAHNVTAGRPRSLTGHARSRACRPPTSSCGGPGCRPPTRSSTGRPGAQPGARRRPAQWQARRASPPGSIRASRAP